VSAAVMRDSEVARLAVCRSSWLVAVAFVVQLVERFASSQCADSLAGHSVVVVLAALLYQQSSADPAIFACDCPDPCD